jgi:hypothetical protein
MDIIVSEVPVASKWGVSVVKMEIAVSAYVLLPFTKLQGVTSQKAVMLIPPLQSQYHGYQHIHTSPSLTRKFK